MKENIKNIRESLINFDDLSSLGSKRKHVKHMSRTEYITTFLTHLENYSFEVRHHLEDKDTNNDPEIRFLYVSRFISNVLIIAAKYYRFGSVNRYAYVIEDAASNLRTSWRQIEDIVANFHNYNRDNVIPYSPSQAAKIITQRINAIAKAMEKYRYNRSWVDKDRQTWYNWKNL